MTKLERDSWFNTGSMVVLVFASLVWKGPTIKVRVLHAAILFATFLLVRFLYTKFSRTPAQGAVAENEK